MSTEDSTQQLLTDCLAQSSSRFDFWAEFVRQNQLKRVVEVGVYQGDFAASLLARCPAIEKYYMLDPWRHLDDWNKPANQDDPTFKAFFEAAKKKTDFAADRRMILRGKTTEVVDQIADGELDFAYIDGDHTLRGIAIDLIRVFPKVRVGGFVGGDDFTRTVWAHHTRFEPTLVFPFAVYFAEAMGATIYALPYVQFCLQKTESSQFRFVDLTGQYDDSTLRSQFAPDRLLKLSMAEKFPRSVRAFQRAKSILRGRPAAR